MQKWGVSGTMGPQKSLATQLFDRAHTASYSTSVETRNVWQSLAYSPLSGVVSPLAYTNETHLLTCVPEVTRENQNFRRWMYKFSFLKLWGHWTEFHQISTRCTAMIADYSTKINIAISQSVWKRQRDEWRSSSNCGQIAAKIARFKKNFTV